MKFFIGSILLLMMFSSLAVADKSIVEELPKTGGQSIVVDEEDPRVIQSSRMMAYLMRLAPRSSIVKDSDYRVSMAMDIVRVSRETGVPHHLLTMIFFLESSYRLEAVGGKGEVGIGQVMDPHLYDCDYSNRLGQMRCSANYLLRGYKKCGSWEGAISNYGSKYGTCKPSQGTRLYRVVKFRMRKWARLRRKFPVDNTN